MGMGECESRNQEKFEIVKGRIGTQKIKCSLCLNSIPLVSGIGTTFTHDGTIYFLCPVCHYMEKIC